MRKYQSRNRMINQVNMTTSCRFISKIMQAFMMFLLAIVIVACGDADDTGINIPDDKPPVINREGASIWLGPSPMDITTDRSITSDYIEVVTQPEKYYSAVFEETKVLKLYIEALNRYSAADIQALAYFANANSLEIAVELGGIRMAVGKTADSRIGLEAAIMEFSVLKKLLDVGGLVNYITTDHSMAPYLTGLDDALADLSQEQIMVQQMEYFQYMQERIPELKVGVIESLGWFWVNGDRQYEATSANLGRVDFESYFDTYLKVAEQEGIVIDHFHIDFGDHDIHYDGGYGRVLAVEDYVLSKGVNSGFIATNAFHNNFREEVTDPEKASREAAENTLDYFEGYMAVSGKSELILQRWQPYPILLGSDEEPYTQMGIFHSIVSSSYFKKDPNQ
ncbi:hypothetical protein [Carboxylicivirga sp. RSCT41]|uniref:hypothetical protein n=1 Tax=Carboxylicivirga agarovorans TaxID=3417570 RepID=UPI003D330116